MTEAADDVVCATTALMKAVSAVGGLRGIDLQRSHLGSIPRVAEAIERAGKSADLADIISTVIRNAIGEISESYDIRIGRGPVKIKVSAEQARTALMTLLNEPPSRGTALPTPRRYKVIEYLDLPGDLKTFRYPEAGPQIDLISILARKLVPEEHRRDTPIAFERVEIEYIFVKDSEPPTFVRLDRAIVDCKVRVLTSGRGFIDRSSYLIDWPRVYFKPFWEDSPDPAVELNPSAHFQSLVGCTHVPAGNSPELLLGVEFPQPLSAGDSWVYGYEVKYPPCKQSRPLGGLAGGGYELFAKPQASIAKVIISINSAGRARMAYRHEWFGQRGWTRHIQSELAVADDGAITCEFSNPAEGFKSGIDVIFDSR